MHAAYCKPDFAGCEVLTAMTKKSILFWHVTLCKLVEVYHVSEQTFEFHKSQVISW
jgi:hypothetical protein